MFIRINSSSVFLILILFVNLLVSCNEIIEKDISAETPIVILPQSNDTVANNPVHFKWKEMTGATSYHLEIVSPSFNNISTYNLDSIVTGSNFYLSLDSTHYEFRITAMNGAYTSKTLGPIPFFVGSAPVPPPPSIILISPIQDKYYNAQGSGSNHFNGNFTWQTIPNAIYTFEIHNGPSFADSLISLVDQISLNGISSASLSGQSLGEGAYSWGVKAFTASGAETVYTKRIFYIDPTSPGNAVQTTPTNNDNLQEGNITFSWTLPNDIGTIQSPVSSILQISTDNSFTTLLTPDTTNSLSFTKNLSADTYYWRVRTVDHAGNLGDVPTSYFTLIVSP